VNGSHLSDPYSGGGTIEEGRKGLINLFTSPPRFFSALNPVPWFPNSRRSLVPFFSRSAGGCRSTGPPLAMAGGVTGGTAKVWWFGAKNIYPVELVVCTGAHPEHLPAVVLASPKPKRIGN